MDWQERRETEYETKKGRKYNHTSIERDYTVVANALISMLIRGSSVDSKALIRGSSVESNDPGTFTGNHIPTVDLEP